MKKTLLALSIAFASSSALAYGEFNYEYEVGPWQKSTNYSYTLDGSSSAPENSNPTTEKIYKNMESKGVSFSAKADDGSNYYQGVLSYGAGTGFGSLIDNNYYTQDYIDPDNPTLHLSQKSKAEIRESIDIKMAMGHTFKNSNAWYTKANLGLGANFIHSLFYSKGAVVTGSEMLFSSSKQSQYNVFLDMGLEKNLTNNLSLSFDSDFILLSHLRTIDTKYLNKELGNQSVEISTYNYGIDTKIGMKYKISNFILSAGANYIFTQPYSSGTATFKDKANNSTSNAVVTSQEFSSLGYFANITYRL